MKHIPLILPAVLACAALSSCSYVQRQFFSQKAAGAAEERRRNLPPLYLGSVHQVYPAQRFALLRIIGPMPRPGATLITHPADDSVSRMGNLVVSADSTPNRNIVVADIRSGSVESGDRVFLYRNISRQPEPEEQAEQGERTEGEPDDVITETPPAAARTPELPALRPPERGLPQPAAPALPAQPQLPTPLPQEPAALPSAAPQGPLHQPVMPSLPESAPAYLNDIPDDINQWD